MKVQLSITSIIHNRLACKMCTSYPGIKLVIAVWCRKEPNSPLINTSRTQKHKILHNECFIQCMQVIYCSFERSETVWEDLQHLGKRSKYFFREHVVTKDLPARTDPRDYR